MPRGLPRGSLLGAFKFRAKSSSVFLLLRKCRPSLALVGSIKHLLNEIHYELVRTIAEGGMGVVYEAVQRGAGNFRKRVAIKLIREEYSALEAFQKNFIGEARLVADLIHTNIVQTYHLGQLGGQYFMVMEYVQGVSLEQFLERHQALRRPVPLDLAAFIVSRVARGLTYAHQKRDIEGRPLGLVHRDISPKNILLGPDGPVILDAECACYGDPAFDVSFMLNHLLLKAAHKPAASTAYAAEFRGFVAAYFAEIKWEPSKDLEIRVARMLPAMLLARVDGKSPVEYLDEPKRSKVRRISLQLMDLHSESIDEIQSIWYSEVIK